MRGGEHKRIWAHQGIRIMRRTTLAAIAAVSLAGAATFALAHQPGHGPGHGSGHQPGHGSGHGPGMMMHGMMGDPGGGTPASRGYMDAMRHVQRDMAMPMMGNADRDFVAMMIPHHQSAVEMARVVVQHGSDPEVRTLAEAIIRDQEREIGQMRTILARMPAQ